MSSRFYIFLLLLIFSGAVYAGVEVLPYKSDVVIDGVNNEWSAHLPKFDKKTSINYSIANDERNLFIIMRITNEAVQKLVIQNGLEVWINKQGKNKKVTGITFPLPMKKEMKKANAMLSGQKLPDRGQQFVMEMGMPLPNNELTLKGFLIDNGTQPTKNCPVKVSLARDQSNCLIYELAIPFNTFYKEKLDQSDVKVKFSIGIIVKGEETTKGNEMGGMSGMGGPGGGPGGMGGPGGGPGGMDGPGGGMGMGGQGQMNANVTVSDIGFWIKTLLAIK
ncbi:MAG: hypothetical protein PHR38_05575 [Bacteroidales bacterium]|nr:hypothetical protein [Bacteroidales bacterium]MDD4712635.1 hypothetical protein [Bacteroidales bacterium]